MHLESNLISWIFIFGLKTSRKLGLREFLIILVFKFDTNVNHNDMQLRAYYWKEKSMLQIS